MKRFTPNATIDMIFILFLTGMVLFLLSMKAQAQNVGINNASPHNKSLLDLTSSDKGLLVPRMTEAQRIAMFPAPDASANGMLVYQTDNAQGFYVFNGNSWQAVNNGNEGWGLNGNTGTTPAANFIGTSDNNEVVFKANNNEAIRIKTNKRVGIGSTNPFTQLTVAANDTNTVVFCLQNSNAGGYSGQWFQHSNGSLAGHTGFGNPSAPKWQNSVYTGSIGAFPFIITTTDTERMRIQADGKVGVGTNAPVQKFDVAGNINLTNDTNNIRFNNIRVFSTAGSSNVFAGRFAGIYNTSGIANTAIGDSAHMMNTGGSSNVAVGYAALKNNTANWNTAVGSRVLAANTTGFSNTGVGIGALVSNTNGYRNTGLGGGTLQETTSGFENTAVGYYALKNNKAGNANVAVGAYALVSDTSGHSNSALGRGAGGANLSGIRNVFVGTWSGAYNTTGSSNVYTGFDAGGRNTTGSRNTHIGTSSGFTNQTGQDNTSVGYNAGFAATSGMNTFIGSYSGAATNSGEANTFIGFNSGNQNTTGTGNTALGRNAQVGASLTNATAIGNNSVVSSSNSLVLGGTGADAVNVGIGITTPTVPLSMPGTMGDKISLFPFGGAHYGMGVQPFLLQLYSATVNDDIALGFGSSNAFTERFRVKGNGNIGAGIANPQARFHMLSDGWTGFQNLKITENSGDFARVGLYNTATAKFWEITAQPDTNEANARFNIFYNTTGNLFSVSANGRVGINNGNPTAALDVNGYTKLGSNAPAVRMLKINGVTNATVGFSQSIAHGLNVAKILSVSVLVEKSATNLIPPGVVTTGDEYSFTVTTSQVVVTTRSGNGANVAGKNVRILITYEE